VKILHLLDERWDSGLTAYALQIAALQRSKGHLVCLGVRPGKKPQELAAHVHLRTRAVRHIFDVFSVFSEERWDVVNAHTGRTHTWAVVARLLRGERFPIVRTRGDARPVNIHPLTRFVYGRTDAFIAASEHVQHQFEERGLNLEKSFLRTIYPAVTPGDHPIPLPGKVVGILGRLDPVKGHATLLEAAAGVLKKDPDVRFLIAGKEANISYSLLTNQAKQLGIDHAVNFLGFQPSARDFMRRCSIGVISSIGSEEVSRACLEWMAEGRPVLGTLVGCLPELIEPEENGLLVPPGDSEMLKEGIKNERIAVNQQN
jgi:glycosyltransferase involved in cell wall biosynthesis